MGDETGDAGNELALPVVVGCVPCNGWLVLEKYAEHMPELDKPPPRNYGVIDQVKVDLRAPVAVITWTLILGGLTYGIATVDWISIAIFAFAAVSLGSSSRRNILISVGRTATRSSSIIPA